MAFQGVYTALVTPFTPQGAVDGEALKRLVEDQIAAGVAGLVPAGTTGESPTLNTEEHLDVIAKVVEWAKGRVPVIAGAGSNSTAEALHLTRHAKDLGATATLQVVPYYNRPNQEGLYRHFMELAEVGLPLLIYNIAPRTARNLETDTLIRLAQHPQIVGVKEASGDIGQMMDVIARRPKGFSVLSGDDVLTLPLMALGGDGIISVISHLVPREFVAMARDALAGNFEKARDLHYRVILPVAKALALDVNPIPVKSAMALQGRLADAFRLPLVSLDDAKKAALKTALQTLGLL
jgi:4-hydroxy-tetrahydrodipicolinate synthase